MPNQLQINQGPQDALLYDNSNSYFTNVGYVRTSNFQIEYKDVEAQNDAKLGSTVQYVIPKAADLLGNCDLCLDLEPPSDWNCKTHTFATGDRAWAQWVDELGYAMIERVTFSCGSNDIQSVTGEELQLKNELMTSDEMRFGYKNILKTGQPAFTCDARHDIDPSDYPLPDPTSTTDEGQYDVIAKAKGKRGATDYTRIICYKAKGDHLTGDDYLKAGGRRLQIPLQLFFTQHVGQYFPLAAVAGCNDIRITIKFRPLNELVQVSPSQVGASDSRIYPQIPSWGSTAPISKAKLRCQFVHVTAPEAQTLMNKEHVRLLKLYQHEYKTYSWASPMQEKSMTMDLSFMHPVSTLIITIRRTDDMNSDAMCSATNANAAQKGFFFYHGDGTNPNFDRALTESEHADIAGSNGTSRNTVNVKSIKLSINGNERHPGLDDGLDTNYLQHRMLQMLHSNSSQYQKQALARSKTAASPGLGQAFVRVGRLKVGANVDGATGTAITYGEVGTAAVPTGSGVEEGAEPQEGDRLVSASGKFVTCGAITQGTYVAAGGSTRKSIAIVAGSVVDDLDGANDEGDIYRLVDINQESSVAAAQHEYGMHGSKNIFVYPFSLNPEGNQPSGAINFSKVSHCKLELKLHDGEAGKTEDATNAAHVARDTKSANGGYGYRVDVYALYYNWLQIKDGRAMLSFA